MIAIIKDTRESNDEIYLFKGSEFAGKVIMVRNNLNVGDFSISGYENEIMIERKTMSDLCGSFTFDRERFENEWKRTTQKFRYLLIEGNVEDSLLGNYRSKFRPNSLLGSLMSWQLKYNIIWFFVPDAMKGQKFVYFLFSNFLRLKNKGEL